MLVFLMIKTESQMKQKCELLKKSWKLIAQYMCNQFHIKIQGAIFSAVSFSLNCKLALNVCVCM